MKSRKTSRSGFRSKLGLELLEDRWVPATVVFSGGNLSISNPTHLVAGQYNLSVIQNPTTGQFAISDGGYSSGSYNVTGGITITGSNLNDVITVTLNNTAGKGVLPGNLTIYGENGNDIINVDGVKGDGSERISGNLYVDGGYGNDVTNVGVSKGLNIRGNSNVFIGNYGNDTLNLGNPSSSPGTPTTTFGGAISVYSTQTVNVSNANISGGQFYTLSLAPTNSTLKVASLNITYANVNSVLSSNAPPLIINGGNLGDSFTSDASTILGNTSIVEGGGDNFLSLNSRVYGNFAYTAGDGDNVVDVLGSTDITGVGALPGNLSFKLGNGANTYFFAAGSTVGGNLIINAGNGGASVSPVVNLAISTAVTGNVSITLGTATNNVTFNSPATFTKFFYSFGGGGEQNTVDFNNDNSGQILAQVNIPAQVGNYQLQVNYNPPTIHKFDAIKLTGGTNAGAESSGSIVINELGNTVSVDSSTLQGTIAVTENP